MFSVAGYIRGPDASPGVEEFVRKPVVDDTPRDRVRSVIALIHGIRTYGHWMEEVKDALEFEGARVVPVRFGHLNVFMFVFATLLRRRSTQYRLIAGTMVGIRQSYPKAKISIIAHSFGTFCIADLIHRNQFNHLDDIVFCGSIVPMTFPWSKFGHRFNRVFNDCGEKDVWPVVARSVAFHCGDSGRFGFGDSALVVNRFHPELTHSDFLNKGFARRYWRPIFRGDPIPAGAVQRQSPKGIRMILLSLNAKYMAVAFVVLLASWCFY